MASHLPIACTLTGAELPERLAEIAAFGDRYLLGATTEGTRSTLRFRPLPEARERLEAIVAAESECCAFLEMEVRERDVALELRVVAPEDAELALEELVAAFGGREQTA